MISGGNVTVFISNMDAAVEFYTQVLELKLINRYGDFWATIDAGRGLVIGLHPASPKYAAPGTRGSMVIALEITEPIDGVVERLQQRGVKFTGPVVSSEAGKFIDFSDPDGNPFYFWEVVPEPARA